MTSKIVLLLLLAAPWLGGQIVPIDGTDLMPQARVKINNNDAYLDSKQTWGTTLPNTCFMGQLFFKTNAPAGQNTYVALSAGTPCTTWTQQAGGGSSGWTRDATNGILSPSVATDKVVAGGTPTTTSVYALAAVAPAGTQNNIGLYGSSGALAGEIWAATSGQVTLNYPGVTASSNNWFVFRFGGAANKLYFGDDGTKAWIQTPHPINFTTNNGSIPTHAIAPQLTLDTGKVGIGMPTPATSLHIAGTLPTLRMGDSTLAGCIELGNSDGSAGMNYLTVLNGTLTVSTTKPGVCQ